MLTDRCVDLRGLLVVIFLLIFMTAIKNFYKVHCVMLVIFFVLVLFVAAMFVLQYG
jgi:hypothetical protein